MCWSMRKECLPLLLRIYAIAKSRCDYYFEHLSMSMTAQLAFESGLFETIDEVTEPFYRTSQTLKNDTIISFQILHAVYRVALVRGDLDAIAQWQQVYEQYSAAARLLKFGICSDACINTMLAAHDGDVNGALEHLKDFHAALHKLGLVVHVVDTLMFMPYLILLLFDPMRSGLPILDAKSNNMCLLKPWSHEQLMHMKTVIITMKEMMKVLGVIHHHIASFWLTEIFETTELLLLGRRNEAMKVAKRKLQSRRKAELEGMPSVKAMYHGLIAKYSSTTLDAVKSREAAFVVFKELKSRLYLKWLES
ncbi:hypothetical protein HK101_010193 [Irineochytrium annulatum]|nr:hypothetical protein HK101_010193 [Irineochytrium annulatum]